MKKVYLLFAIFFLASTLYTSYAQKLVPTTPQKKNAIIEEFTGVRCTFCPDGHARLKATLDKYPTQVFAVCYHPQSGSFNEPLLTSDPDFRRTWPDPLWTNDFSGYLGMPGAFINRKLSPEPSQSNNEMRWQNRGRWMGSAEAVIQENSPVNIGMEAKYDKNTNELTVNIELYYTEDVISKHYLVVVLSENELVAEQINAGVYDPKYVHYHTFREGLTATPWGDEITQEKVKGTLVTKTYKFKNTKNYDIKKCELLAMVRSGANEEIVTGVGITTVPQIFSPLSVEEPFLKIPAKGDVTKSFTVTNPQSKEITVNFAIESAESYLLSGWTAEVTPKSVKVPANGTATANVKFTTNDVPGFCYATVKGTATAGAEENPVSSKIVVYALSEKTKNAVYVGTSGGAGLAFDALAVQTDYKSNTAMVPLGRDLINAYPPAEMFDMVTIPIDYNNRGMIGVSYDNGLINDIVNSMVNAGKKILVTSEVDMAIGFGSQGTGGAKYFYQNMLGIKPHGSPGYAQRFQQVGQQLNILTFPLSGVSGDPIGEGINATMNQYNSQTHPYFLYYTDLIEILSAATQTTPCLYYDNKTENVAGVKSILGDGKMVYLSFGFEGIANQAQRNLLMKNIVDWFASSGPAKGPELTTDVSSLTFGDTKVGDSTSKSFEIKNTGDKELKVTSIEFGFGEDGFEFVDLPPLPIFIEPNGTVQVSVQFKPASEGDFTEVVDIKSDAINGDQSVTVMGKGVGGSSSVQDGVYSVDGLSINVGPNPFAAKANVHYILGGNISRQVSMKLIDATGREVARLLNEVVAPGDYNMELLSKGLSAGTYYIIANIGGQTLQVPVVIIK